MSVLREAIGDWLRAAADRVHRPAHGTPMAQAAEPDDLTIPAFPEPATPHIPARPASPPAHATPEQIRAAHNRRLLRQEALGREGIVRIEHLGRVS